MKALILGLFFVSSLTAHAGPAVSGGSADVCDPEKGPLMKLFIETDFALNSLVAKLTEQQFYPSCASGNSHLIRPDSAGVEYSEFSVRFSNNSLAYKITLFYKAQRQGMGANYKGHRSGERDGTSLHSPELLRFEVTPEKVSNEMGIGF